MRTSEMFVIMLLIIALGLLFLNYWEIKKDESHAATDPFTFSIEKLEEKYNENLSCTCNAGKYIMNSSGVWKRAG